MGMLDNADREAELLDAQMDEGTLLSEEYDEAMAEMRAYCRGTNDEPSEMDY